MAEKPDREGSAAQNVAEQNRRKLEEHLARMKERARSGGKGAADPAKGKRETGEAPKPPPKPSGWEAWKKIHGENLHQLRHADPEQLAREADYHVLELKPGASREDVKRSFNRLAKKFHPDHGGDAEIFQAMLAAYGRIMKGGGK